MSFFRRGRWKLERASVHRRRARRPRSNKFSGGDVERKPVKHARQQVWVGSYKRKGRTKKVRGYFRHNAQYRA